MDYRGKSIFLLSVTLVLASTGLSANYAVNSMDWKDVYTGMEHTFDQGEEEAYFVRSSDASGLTTLMPNDEPVHILESTETPYTGNLESILESKDYTVGNTTQFSDASIELADSENYIVISESYPSSAVAVSPLARELDADVLIVNSENVEDAETILSQADGEVVLAGVFERDIRNTVEPYSTEEIIEPNRFELSVKIVERYLEENPDQERVFITDGSHLESDVVKGEYPVLISGTNLVPETVDSFLFENPDHELSTAVMVGNEMTTVGQTISDTNITRNGETTSEQMDVFVKYGQARGDSSQIYALSMFPLPSSNIELEIGEVQYDPEDRNLVVNYRNRGSSKMYALTNMRITNQNQQVATAGDGEPIFISGGSTQTIEYSLNLTPGQYQNATVEFSTSYGDTPDNLDTYLTEEGRFSPPVEKQIKVKNVEDRSEINLIDVTYLTDIQRIKIDVRNTGNTTAYFSAQVNDLTVRGLEEDFSTDTESVEPDQTESAYIPVELDSVDLEENDEFSTVLRYGESQDLKINRMENTTAFETSSRGITGQIARSPGVAGAGIAVLAVLVLIFFKKETIVSKIQSVR